MKKWEVLFEIYRDISTKARMNYSVVVEAGTKKLAVLRAIEALNKLEEYANDYKSVKEVKEVT